MGTNYYWQTVTKHMPNGKYPPIDMDDPAVHIGKRSAAGGSSMVFTWAQEATATEGICSQHEDEPLVIDEYGRVLTGRQFKDVVSECAFSDTEAIGEWFS